MARFFHVTSTRNRASIETYGLDWRRMGTTPGIAGSTLPEQHGCFVCLDEWEIDWFVRMNNTGGPVDVWAIDGVNEDDLVVAPEGHHYLPKPIPPARLSLARSEIPTTRT